MSRIRNIKPDFFVSEDTATLPDGAQLLYIGLWTEADKKGCLLYQVFRLKTRIRPMASIESVQKDFETLIERGLVVPYDDNKYLYIPTFRKHQYISTDERKKKSILPEPPGFIETVLEESKTPLYGQQTTDNRQQTGILSKSTAEESNLELLAVPAEKQPDPFLAFWAAYPRKDKKKGSEVAYRRALKLPGITADFLLDAVERQRETIWVGRETKHIPQASAWLNGERWNDEVSAFGAEGGLSEKKARAPEVPRNVGVDLN